MMYKDIELNGVLISCCALLAISHLIGCSDPPPSPSTITPPAVEMVGGEMASGERAGDERAGGERAGGERAGGERAGGERTGGERAGGERTGGERTGGERTGGERTGGERAGGEMTGGERTGGERAGGEMAGGEMAGGYVDINQLEWSDMCVHWNRTWDRVEQVRWTGSTAQCDPGMLNDQALESAVELTNLYRGLAGLSPITLNRSISNDLQACALMMDANNSLSHQPPETWSCFSSNGAYMASQSNIAGSSAIDAIGMYMIDPGNQTTIGHRRWLLSLGLESVGIGSTDNYSCMAVLHRNRPRGWVAFPSPGPFPIQAMVDRWGRSVDQVGWTFQYDGFNLSDPQVSITAYSANESEGEVLAVNVVTLRPNFGSSQALNMIPQGWQSEIGKRYEVRIVSGDESFEYAVDFVDCDQVR